MVILCMGGRGRSSNFSSKCSIK